MKISTVARNTVLQDITKFANGLNPYEQDQFSRIPSELLAKIWQAASLSALDLLQQVQRDANVEL